MVSFLRNMFEKLVKSHLVKVDLYNCAGLGLIMSILCHLIFLLAPEMIQSIPGYILIVLFVGAVCIAILSGSLLATAGKAMKRWIFFRYTPLWLTFSIVLGMLYGGVNAAFLFLQDKEDARSLEQHAYRSGAVVEEMHNYQADQERFIQYISGIFIGVYSVLFQFLGSIIYEPIDALFLTLGNIKTLRKRTIASCVLPSCKQGKLLAMIDALHSTSLDFRKELVNALSHQLDSRAVIPLLALFEHEGESIHDLLSIFLQTCCHHTRMVMFGQTVSHRYNRRHTLRNPDVLRLTVPMPRLQRLIIETSTSDFYCIERFLTYAINFIGQSYLKHAVYVDIYGNPEHLPSNIKNNLINLCRQVTIHERAKGHSEDYTTAPENPGKEK